MAAVAQGTYYTSGAIIAVTDNGKGEYTVTQVEASDVVPKAPEGAQGIININSNIGPFKVQGSLDTNNLYFQSAVSCLGVYIGIVRGYLSDPLVVNIDIGVAKGKITISVKDGHICIAAWDIKPIIGPSLRSQATLCEW